MKHITIIFKLGTGQGGFLPLPDTGAACRHLRRELQIQPKEGGNL